MSDPGSDPQDDSQSPPPRRSSWLGPVIGLAVAVAVLRACYGAFFTAAPPASHTAASPAGWQEYRPLGEGFSVKMPGTPTRTEQTVRSEGLDIKVVTHMWTDGPIGYGVTTGRLPALGPLAPDELDNLFDGAVDGMLRNSGAELASQTKITFDGYPGREVRATRAAHGDEPALVLDARVFLVRDTEYALILVRPEAQRYLLPPDPFFDSFQLVAGTLKKAIWSRPPAEGVLVRS